MTEGMELRDKRMLLQALQDDASDLWKVTNAIKKEIESRSWIMEGRGCYAWDDDRYRDETRLVFEAVLNLIKNVQHPAQLRFHGIVAKVLKSLPTEQDTRIKNLEIQLKNWQDFYVADVKPSTFEQEIREKTQDKIARDLYKIIADNNYDMASVIRYLDKIVKLKAGQSPKEV